MKHLTPNEAHQYTLDHPDAVLIDCRSEKEFLFVGQVKKISSVHRPVVLICRSGNRSVDAGHALEAAGFSEVYNVLEGFEGHLDDDHHRGIEGGWRKEGLPWEQC